MAQAYKVGTRRDAMHGVSGTALNEMLPHR